MSEEWRPVVGYEGLYEVSNAGRVRSLRKKTRIKDKESNVMRQKFDNRGYLRVNIYNGKCKAELISRMVAKAFIPNPNNLPQVGHMDDNKLNNHVSNLYWTDSRENNHHNGKMDRLHAMHKAKISQIAQKLSMPVIGISIADGTEIRYESMQQAARHGFESGRISMCVNGKRNSHRGYKWRKA